MATDAELLEQFVSKGAQDAFTELVRRHTALVYLTALRQVNGDALLAEETTQAVFIAMGQNASNLTRYSTLIGWLHVTTCYTARKLVRSLCRRRKYEQDARVAEALTADEGAAEWEQLRPVVDDVLLRLGSRDRDVLLLRFFTGLPFVEIGRRLNLTEDGARLRVNRALEKAGRLFRRQGVASTAAAISAAFGSQSLAAPAGLAARVASSALSRLQGVGHASTFVAQITQFMASSKIVVGSVIGLLVVVVGTSYVARRSGLSAPDDSRNRLASRASSNATPVRTAATSVEPTSAGESTRPNLPPAHGAVAAPDPRSLLPANAELGVIAIRSLTDLGTATPRVALETFLNAIAHGTKDDIAKQLSLTSAQKEKLQAVLATLSDSMRKQYPDPEHLIASSAMFEGTVIPPDGTIQVVSETKTADAVAIEFHIEPMGAVNVPLDSSNRSRLDLQNTPTGWKVAVPDYVVAKFIKQLTAPLPHP